MKKCPLGLAVIGLSAILTGCGSQADCASSDVQETYLGMVGNLDEDAMDILKSSVFESVVTRDEDPNTGYRYCSAKIVMENEARVGERNVSYEVAQVESSDANFEVYADRMDLGMIRHMAIALAKEDRVAKKTKDMREDAESNPYVPADEQDARDAGIAFGRRRFAERLDETSVRAEPVDIDGDGVMEFVTSMKINFSSGSSKWYVFATYQFPKGPGEKNSVGYVGEGTVVVLDVEPSGYEMQEENLYVTMPNGSRASLLYLTSADGYQAYIKGNAGG